MTRKLLLCFLIGLTLNLWGCITEYTPEESVIELNSGASQLFTAVTDDRGAELVWYLDGEKVANGKGKYTFTAEKNSSGAIIQHKLLVREENGRYQRFYRMFGLPENFAVSFTWTIKVLPGADPVTCYLDEDGDGFGDNSKMVASDNPPTNCIADNSDCDDGNASIHPSAAEVCGNDVDENCDGAADACTGEDLDGDGYTEADGDCDDTNADINPGAAEICDNDIDENCDDIVAACTPEDVDGDGYTEGQGDCDDDNASVNPGAEEVCGNDIDENCDGAAEACQQEPDPVTNVDASDIESGLTHITVAWSAGPNADYYNVYRSPWEEDGDYELVGQNITATTFDYIQTWDADVYQNIGDFPAFAPNADYQAKGVFAERLAAYGESVIPFLFNFKAPAFFKVEACNSVGCSELSFADRGQAEFIHTAEHSEVALLAIPGWGNAGLGMLADAPPGAQALNWCGIDICGPGGGMILGRLEAENGLPMVDVYYEDYIEIWDRYPATARFTSSGWLGGVQQLIPAMQGILNLSGDFDLSVAGVDIHMFVYMHVGGNQGPNSGYVSITYKEVTHQFSLPVVDRGDGFSDPPEPVVEDDEANRVRKRETVYPTPFAQTPPPNGCLTLKDDPVEICQ